MATKAKQSAGRKYAGGRKPRVHYSIMATYAPLVDRLCAKHHRNKPQLFEWLLERAAVEAGFPVKK